MKSVKLIIAVAAICLLAAPVQTAKAQNSALSGVVSALTASNGNSAGSALLGLYSQYKADGKLDLQNASNIKNLLTLAQNIKGLAQTKNTTNFLSGLITGSKNLVNNSNSSTVLSSLSNLSKLDLSSLGTSVASSAAKSAASGLLSKVASGAKNTATSAPTNSATNKASSILTSLFGKLK